MAGDYPGVSSLHRPSTFRSTAAQYDIGADTRTESEGTDVDSETASAIVLAVGALAAGALAGTVALAYFAYFVRRLTRGTVVKFAPTATLGILFGSSIASAPVGLAVFSANLWPWYTLGEAVVFLPGALIVVYRYVLKP